VYLFEEFETSLKKLQDISAMNILLLINTFVIISSASSRFTEIVRCFLALQNIAEKEQNDQHYLTGRLFTNIVKKIKHNFVFRLEEFWIAAISQIIMDSE